MLRSQRSVLYLPIEHIYGNEVWVILLVEIGAVEYDSLFGSCLYVDPEVVIVLESFIECFVLQPAVPENT